MNVKIITIDPKKIKLLELNARFMRHEVFSRLVDNLKEDDVMTSVPFCAMEGYYSSRHKPKLDEKGDPIWECLSGNHRVMAAIEAGLTRIKVMVTEEPVSENKRKQIQLSHNAIVGEDDPTLLKTIYESIDDINMRVQSGLDDRTLKLFDEIKVNSLTEAKLMFQNVTMLFLPHEVEKLEEAWNAAQTELAGSKEVWIARMEEYSAALDLLEIASRSIGVKNIATAMIVVLNVAMSHLEDFRAEFLDENGNPKRNNSSSHVPLETILESPFVKATTASKLERATQAMIRDKAIEDREDALDYVVTYFEKNWKGKNDK